LIFGFFLLTENVKVRSEKNKTLKLFFPRIGEKETVRDIYRKRRRLTASFFVCC